MWTWVELGAWTGWLGRDGWDWVGESGGGERCGWNRGGGVRMVELELEAGSLEGTAWLLEVGGRNWVWKWVGGIGWGG